VVSRNILARRRDCATHGRVQIESCREELIEMLRRAEIEFDEQYLE